MTEPIHIYQGDALEVLRTLPAASVQCVVTSPPYWGLRDYGVAGQLGLEKTPQEYVGKLVEVFREVRRVLRDDGTLWLNLGDTYSGGNRGGNSMAMGKAANASVRIRSPSVLPAGNLLGMPWRVAFALQEDGWILRQDLIWHKPSPMPESVTNRCTKAHEYVFLLVKQLGYFCDMQAIKETATAKPQRRLKPHPKSSHSPPGKAQHKGIIPARAHKAQDMASRNKRSVWTIASEGFAQAHFATFPKKLVELCIKAGTSAHGACGACGAPWRRLIRKQVLQRERLKHYVKRNGTAGTGNSCANSAAGVVVETLGWGLSCGCNVSQTRPCVVLDPFLGSGTTALVARRLGRAAIGIELSPVYVEMARKRLQEDSPLFNSVVTTENEDA